MAAAAVGETKLLHLSLSGFVFVVLDLRSFGNVQNQLCRFSRRRRQRGRSHHDHHEKAVNYSQVEPLKGATKLLERERERERERGRRRKKNGEEPKGGCDTSV